DRNVTGVQTCALPISIPELTEPILDNDGIDIEHSFEAIRKGLLRHELNYRVDEGASLRLLQFATFQMWRDLTDHWEMFIANPVEIGRASCREREQSRA